MEYNRQPKPSAARASVGQICGWRSPSRSIAVTRLTIATEVVINPLRIEGAPFRFANIRDNAQRKDDGGKPSGTLIKKIQCQLA